MNGTMIHVRNVDLNILEEFCWASFYGIVFTIARWIANRFVLGSIFVTQEKSLLTRRERVFEEIWLAILSFGFLLISWMVFLDNDVGASIFNTHPIIKDWPMNFVTYDVVYLLRVETGWYVHQMTRGRTGSGVPIDSLMFYHHIGTLLIIVFSFWTNLLLLGALTLSVFNISNPFLHISKMVHAMNMVQARKILFICFGVAFFLSRILLLPMTVMKIGYVDAYKEDYKTFGTELIILGNIMMVILYALQIFWMAKIFRVLLVGKTGTTPTKSSKKETLFTQTRPLNGNDKEN